MRTGTLALRTVVEGDLKEEATFRNSPYAYNVVVLVDVVHVASVHLGAMTARPLLVSVHSVVVVVVVDEVVD